MKVAEEERGVRQEIKSREEKSHLKFCGLEKEEDEIQPEHRNIMTGNMVRHSPIKNNTSHWII